MNLILIILLLLLLFGGGGYGWHAAGYPGGPYFGGGIGLAVLLLLVYVLLVRP